METIRQARTEELDYLQMRLNEHPGERVDLSRTLCWVAERDGVIVGMLPLRMVWNPEPMYLFPECDGKVARSRAALGLYRAVERFVADRAVNTTGVHWLFVLTRSKAVMGWAGRLGWHRQWKRAAFFIKSF